MTGNSNDVLVVPKLSIYNVRQNEDIILNNVAIDPDYARDSDGKVLYFDYNEGRSFLAEQGKSIPSLPLLVNLYIVLNELAAENELAARVVAQLNSAWDRTSTFVNPSGTISHSDSVLGNITVEGLEIPRKGLGISELFDDNERFFQALLGVRDIARLSEVAEQNNRAPFYWYPRGERWTMFGGGDFYYMHMYIPNLLMVFCDDEVHPRRILRGVWQEK